MQTLITTQLAQGNDIRIGDIIGGQIIIDLPRIQEITRQYTRRAQNVGDKAGHPSTAKNVPDSAAPADSAPANNTNPNGNNNSAFTNNGGGGFGNLGSATVLPGGGAVGLGGGLTGSGSGGEAGPGPGDSGAVDYAARIAELQRTIEDREKKLR